MIKYIKTLINNYKSYKEEKKQDNLELKHLREQNEIEFERQFEIRKKGDKRLLANKVLFNKNTGNYEFKITVKHDGIPHTFSCEDKIEEGCRDIAGITLIRARFYKATGTYYEL